MEVELTEKEQKLIEKLREKDWEAVFWGGFEVVIIEGQLDRIEVRDGSKF